MKISDQFTEVQMISSWPTSVLFSWKPPNFLTAFSALAFSVAEQLKKTVSERSDQQSSWIMTYSLLNFFHWKRTWHSSIATSSICLWKSGFCRIFWNSEAVTCSEPRRICVYTPAWMSLSSTGSWNFVFAVTRHGFVLGYQWMDSNCSSPSLLNGISWIVIRPVKTE